MLDFAVFLMPSQMLTDALQTLLGMAAFSLLFLSPGYVLAAACNLMGFRSRSIPERFLWAVALSGPVSAVLAAIAGRIIPTVPMLSIFAVLGVAAAVLLALDLRRRWPDRSQDFDRTFWIVAVCVALVAVYCVLATLGVQTHHSLYESVDASDWNIRFPLVQSAVRGGIPPHNPLFAVNGVAPPMRYYYFWYELCAQVVRMTHIPARAAFMASTLWGYLSLIAVTFLLIKYLGTHSGFATVCKDAAKPKQPPASLRTVCVVALGLTFVMGLDLLVALAGLMFHRVRLMPEIEWWHPDRLPSWLGATLVAPHHLAGVAFGAMGFLLLALTPKGIRQRTLHALLAAICFAALVGTSTYQSLCFAMAGGLLAVIRARKREWGMLALLVLCIAIALLLARPFLHEMMTTHGYSAALDANDAPRSFIGNSVLKVVVQNWHFSYGVIGFYARIWHLPFLHNPLRYIFPLMLLPLIYIVELTFYLFVIWYQFRLDFRSGVQPTEKALLLWALFAGFAIPCFLLSSAPLQGTNDLGAHAGLALRLVLIVWAAPMLANAWRTLQSGCMPSPRGRWVVRITFAAIIIGLGGQLWQITLDRIYLPLVAHGLVNSRLFDKGDPFLAIRNASNAAAASVPPDAIVQSNPEGLWQTVFMLYANRQMAAGNEGCEVAFGGSLQVCRTEVIPPLHGIYGGSGLRYSFLSPLEKMEPPADPAQMTATNFAATCTKLHLAALLVSSADPAWGVPTSWVWTQTPLYADDSVRVIPCPSR